MFGTDTGHSAFEEQDSPVQDLTFETLEAAFEGKSMALTDAGMESLRITENGRFTRLGFILSDQFDQPVKVAVYADGNRVEPIERAEYGGSVIRQMRDVSTFIARCNRPSEKGIGMCACPEGSVKEAVANAIVHRDYSVDDAIRISICRTEMTITSPGALNRNYTEEELLMGVSSFRNRNLARVLQRLGLIETYGTGILRIVGSYRGTYVHPEIVAGPSTFTVVLPSMNTAEHPVQRFLDGREEFTRAELEKGMGVSRSRAVATVNRLIEDGRIVRVGAGRAVRYRSDVAPRPRFRTVPGRRPAFPLIARVYARTRVQY